MRKRVAERLYVSGWVLVVISNLALLGCASAADRYRDEQIACVGAYSTRAEIDACRDGVRRAAGLPARDGGAR